MREPEVIINDIKSLIYSQGYIYSLFLILFEDFHFDPEKLHELDIYSRVSINESLLLLGFLIQDNIDYSYPSSPLELLAMKKKTYELLKELQVSFSNPFIKKLKETVKNDREKESKSDFFGHGDMLVEPIFYSGTGVYDFQYIDFLDKKYKHDAAWLKEKKGFSSKEVVEIFNLLKEKKLKESKRVNLYIKDQIPEMLKLFKEHYKGDEDGYEKEFYDFIEMAGMHQYVDLFFNDLDIEHTPDSDEFKNEIWKTFYENLIDLFTIDIKDIKSLSGGVKFLENFSVMPGKDVNRKFQKVGDYNKARSHPLIRYDDKKIILPIPFVVAEAIYECPFYWMIDDKNYKDKSSLNRGEVGEEIVFNILSNVFRKEIYKGVKIVQSKGVLDTDADVLCILGSKALCVQVKSKRLTLLSRNGDDDSLKKDFRQAVQDAYKQGKIVREKIIDRTSSFLDKNGKEITLSEDIDEVFLAVVVTENYPSLNHQVETLIEKDKGDVLPLVMTVFDLELVVHYLNDPYEFMYYVRQRISLRDYFHGQEEMSFLGYHLSRKLWKRSDVDYVALDNSWAQIVDRNYYPIKAGLKVSSDTDPLSKKWKNEDFEILCTEIKGAPFPKTTDIIFHLLDLSGLGREKLVECMKDVKQKTIQDGKRHNFSIPPAPSEDIRFGITYYSSEDNSIESTKSRLLSLCELRKYKSRGYFWLGFGSIRNSQKMVDILVYNKEPWKYDSYLEEQSKVLHGTPKISFNSGKKIGRNEKCPCESGKKFKKCCLNS